MNERILITGSSGLVGTALAPALASRGVDVLHFDVAARGAAHGDVRDKECVRKAVDGAHGIIHLAAVSRVIWGERDPELCRATNVDGLRNVLEFASAAPLRPWVVFASSREVYGQPDALPVDETCPVRPVNVYGRSKVEGERLVEAARRDGMRACIIRLSNVFGSTNDHADRVVPAFARGAAMGQTLRVDGADHTFDFTHIDDVARGIVALAELLSTGSAAPDPIHFVSGVPTTLGQLATMAIRIAGTAANVCHAPPRNFDVAKFYGSFARANRILGWEPAVSLETGLSRLIHDFRNVQGSMQSEERAS